MFNRLFKTYQVSTQSTSQVEAELVRKKLQSIFLKINTHQTLLTGDSKLKFKVTDTCYTDKLLKQSGKITFYLGGYVICYEMNDIKSIQLYRRGQEDSLQFSELLAISFKNQVEFIADALFVKSDLYQLDILISHVINRSHHKIII